MPKPNLSKADVGGGDAYYYSYDLEWACRPTEDDPGMTRPRANAVPRWQDGTPMSDEPEDSYDAWDTPMSDEPEDSYDAWDTGSI